MHCIMYTQLNFQFMDCYSLSNEYLQYKTFSVSGKHFVTGIGVYTWFWLSFQIPDIWNIDRVHLHIIWTNDGLVRWHIYVSSGLNDIHGMTSWIQFANILLTASITAFCFKKGLVRLFLNPLRPRRNGRYNADDIFKCIFLKKNVWIPTIISLKSVPKGPINNIPALVQIMAWRRPGDKALSEPMMVSLLTHTCVTRPQWVKFVPSDLTDNFSLVQ